MVRGDPRDRFGEADLPWHARDDWESHPAYRSAPDGYARLARQYRDDGYAVLPGVVPRALTASIRAALDAVWKGGRRPHGRLTDACWGARPVRDLACLPEILDALSFLYDRRPIPFQTLNFPSGTQQRSHSDFIHFSSLPPRYMCGVWVALEDVDGDQGPLFYHPGSQRLPELSYAEIARPAETMAYADYESFIEQHMRNAGIEPVRFHAREGDALIWSSNLVHGGSLVERPGASRHSQVTHYFFERCVYYTPMRSRLPAGEIFARSPLIDIRTRKPVRQSLDGRATRLVHLASGRSLISTDDDPVERHPVHSVVSAARRASKNLDVWAKVLIPAVLRRPIRR